MPYIMCPRCGSTAHVSVADHKQWYEERGVPFGTLVPHLCFYCWKEIRVGDSVIVRQLFAPRAEVRSGDRGILKAVLSTLDGSLFEVRMQNGKEYYFVRAEIRPLIGAEVVTAGENEEKK